MLRKQPKPGDVVVYRKIKHSTCPGPRAKSIQPAPTGDEYRYTVDKFWVVAEVKPEGYLLLQTRAGKHHEVSGNDPNLRGVNFWDRLFYGKRFPELAIGSENEQPTKTQAAG